MRFNGASIRTNVFVPFVLAPRPTARSSNKIKQCRRVATRYDKLASNYLAFVQLASIRLWLRVYEFTPYSEPQFAPAYSRAFSSIPWMHLEPLTVWETCRSAARLQSV